MKKILPALLLLALPLAPFAQCGYIFQETWESGGYSPTWTVGTAPITWNVGTTSPAVGSYSVTGTGGNSSHLQGLRYTFPTPVTPNYISWYMKPNGTTADNYVVVGNASMSASNCIAFCYWVGTGAPAQIRFISSTTFSYTPPATDVWYQIEMKNINYVAHTFDIWINGVLMQAGFPFRGVTQNDLSQVHLYNFSAGSVGHWDQIQIGGGNSPVGTITTLDPACFGDSTGGCDLTVAGGTAPLSYLWNTGATSEDISGWPAGSYEVVVTDDVGCKDTVAATLNDPPMLLASPSADDLSCAGDSSGMVTVSPSGGTPGYSILWGGGETSFSLTGLSGGDYTYTVTDTNGCTLSDTVSVIEPAPLVVLDSMITPSCAGDSNGAVHLFTSGGTPGYSYTWSTGGTTDVETGLGEGTYTVMVMDNNSCTVIDTFILVEPDTLTLADSVMMPLCNGDNTGSIELTPAGGTPGYTYLWTSGDSTAIRTGLGAGSYTVTVTDTRGCVISSTIMVSEPTAMGASAVVTDAVGGVGGAIDLTMSGGTPGYTYAWSNGATTEDISGLTNGTYTVTVTDANGCTYVFFETVDFVVGVTDPSGNSAQCFPNPFSQELNWSVSLAAPTVATLALYDLHGSLVAPVQEVSLRSGTNALKASYDLPAGVYLWRIAGEGLMLQGKVVRVE